jgi:hypothetical protein
MTSMQQGASWCPVCECQRLVARPQMSLGMGCLLTILSAGLFLVPWIVLAWMEQRQSWVCQTCGEEIVG